MSLVRAVGGMPAILAGNPSAGAMLAHWLESVPIERRAAVLAEAAGAVRAGADPTGEAVLPYLRGRVTPEPDAGARPGRPLASRTASWRARAVVEGICYQARWMMREQSRIQESGDPAVVAVIGGGRLPELWSELTRAALPWPTAWASAAEPVATGAALLGAVRAGLLGDPARMLAHAPTICGPVRPPPGWDPHGAAFEEFVGRARVPS